MNARLMKLVMLGIIVSEFVTLAPVYPYQARIIGMTITPPILADCQAVVWIAGQLQHGWVDIDIVAYDEPVRIIMRDPFGPSILNETNTRFKATLETWPLIEGYRIMMENPGTTCNGSSTMVSGKIEFWHEETRWKGLLSAP